MAQIVVMISWMCTVLQGHQVVYINYVQLFVFHSYLSEDKNIYIEREARLQVVLTCNPSEAEAGES
jgi:hypothetical protein